MASWMATWSVVHLVELVDAAMPLSANMRAPASTRIRPFHYLWRCTLSASAADAALPDGHSYWRKRMDVLQNCDFAVEGSGDDTR